MNINHLIF